MQTQDKNQADNNPLKPGLLEMGNTLQTLGVLNYREIDHIRAGRIQLAIEGAVRRAMVLFVQSALFEVQNPF